MFLTESYVARAASPVVREMTLGGLLRKAGDDHPALIAGVPDPALRRQRTYAQFYRELNAPPARCSPAYDDWLADDPKN